LHPGVDSKGVSGLIATPQQKDRTPHDTKSSERDIAISQAERRTRPFVLDLLVLESTFQIEEFWNPAIKPTVQNEQTLLAEVDYVCPSSLVKLMETEAMTHTSTKRLFNKMQDGLTIMRPLLTKSISIQINHEQGVYLNTNEIDRLQNVLYYSVFSKMRRPRAFTLEKEGYVGTLGPFHDKWSYYLIKCRAPMYIRQAISAMIIYGAPLLYLGPPMKPHRCANSTSTLPPEATKFITEKINEEVKK
jgi:hypothetical protein